MTFGAIIGLGAAIVSLAAITVFLTSNNTSGIIKNIFDGFAGSLRAALGK